MEFYVFRKAEVDGKEFNFYAPRAHKNPAKQQRVELICGAYRHFDSINELREKLLRMSVCFQTPMNISTLGGYCQVKVGKGKTDLSRRVKVECGTSRGHGFHEERGVETISFLVPASMVCSVEGKSYLPDWFLRREIDKYNYRLPWSRKKTRWVNQSAVWPFADAWLALHLSQLD